MCNTAGLEGLVVGPYRWTTANHSTFIRDAYNIIKKEMERLNNIESNAKNLEAAQKLADGDKKKDLISKLLKVSADLNTTHDVEIAQFVQNLIGESCQVLGIENWVDIIGPDLWDILKLDEKGNDRYKLDQVNDTTAASKKKSVCHLVKLIRDKIEHIQTYKDETKEKLKVFFDTDGQGKYHFNENKYIAFWISKFPKLMPYLWLKFYIYKEKLATYYPDYEIDICKRP